MEKFFSEGAVHRKAIIVKVNGDGSKMRRIEGDYTLPGAAGWTDSRWPEERTSSMNTPTLPRHGRKPA